MKARRRLIIPIAVVAIGMGVWILWPRNNNLTGSIQASGTIEATQVGVAPKIAGRVMKISVQEGQQVEAGQVVAELDAAEVDAQARQAQAAVDAARTRPAQADASVTLARPRWTPSSCRPAPRSNPRSPCWRRIKQTWQPRRQTSKPSRPIWPEQNLI